MGSPSSLGEKIAAKLSFQGLRLRSLVRNNKILFIGAVLLVFGLVIRFWNMQPIFHAQAFYAGAENQGQPFESPILGQKQEIFLDKEARAEMEKEALALRKQIVKEKKLQDGSSTGELAKILYEIVEEAPMKEMIPFVAKREERVAAFLVGIAKKESGLGKASPSKNGQDCYNYWGYKGSGGNGVAMGYACFASAEEAVKTVGDRIEVLVNKDRNTPAKMVDTWKCGTSCKGDPGSSSWVSTVAFYFDKILQKNS